MILLKTYNLYTCLSLLYPLLRRWGGEWVWTLSPGLLTWSKKGKLRNENLAEPVTNGWCCSVLPKYPTWLTNTTWPILCQSKSMDYRYQANEKVGMQEMQKMLFYCPWLNITTWPSLDQSQYINRRYQANGGSRSLWTQTLTTNIWILFLILFLNIYSSW